MSNGTDAWSFDLEETAHAFSIISALGTVLLGAIGLLISTQGRQRELRERQQQEYQNQRGLIVAAAEAVHMDFALQVLGVQAYDHPGRRLMTIKPTPVTAGKPPSMVRVEEPNIGRMTPGEFTTIFGRSTPEAAWQREVRQKFVLFLESIRPCAHLLGDSSKDDCNHRCSALFDAGFNPRHDPAVLRLRLSLQAFVSWWDPRSTPVEEFDDAMLEQHRSKCTDEVKEWVRDAYVDAYADDPKAAAHEWECFVTLVDLFFPGRIEGRSTVVKSVRASGGASDSAGETHTGTAAVTVEMNTAL